MRYSVIVLATLALGLAGCGEMKEAAAEGFKTEFVKSFTTECAKAAANTGVPTDKLNQICECTATELVETQSVTELANLDLEKAMPIFQKCAGEAGLQLPGAPAAE